MPRLPQSSESQPFPLPILPHPDIIVGGRLAHFVEQWGELKQNKWVLSVVRNSFRMPFSLTPPLSTVPISLSQSSSLLLREEIMELLQKWAVERVQDPGTTGFYSQLFLVPKKNGKLRPVIDLSLWICLQLDSITNSHCIYLQFQTIDSWRYRHIINELELSTCICISTNNSDIF